MVRFESQMGRVAADVLSEISGQLAPEITRMRELVQAGGYADDRASVNLVDDSALLDEVLSLAERYQDVDALVVIGIGGSNLGTMAVQEAIQGRLGGKAAGTQVFYADTVDALSMGRLIEQVQTFAKDGKRVLLNGISKSGGTIETTANFFALLDAVEQAGGSAKDSVVLTTVEGSKLWQYGQEQGIPCLRMPETVGGRYSVFSAVGLFPLAVAGIDVRALVKGAKAMRDACLATSLDENPAAMSAVVLYAHNQAGIPIHDTFLFASDLESVGKWYRQLMGESIGKEHNRAGEVVHAGMTPTVSMGSTDLHSVVQLYLDGPNDRVTTFVRVRALPALTVPNRPEVGALVGDIAGKPMATIMDAILDGTMIAYEKAERPFMVLELDAMNEESIGAFLQLKMLEMMYLGHLLGVNPFDQPAVEKYKVETKRLLQVA
ncbi:MAG: hypothetical protein ACOYBJ_02175 [Patescibacteria group bacterium]|jgi:glucose-6-phosphate isomerase